MAGPRQPIDVVVAKGKYHITKAEIEKRKAEEVGSLDGEITPPAYLTKEQKKNFEDLAGQLQQLGIFGTTDVQELARYVQAHTMYVMCVRQMRRKEVKNDPEIFGEWLKHMDRFFNQCEKSAAALGLTISSRCRLVVPGAGKQEEKTNKFEKFKKKADA